MFNIIKTILNTEKRFSFATIVFISITANLHFCVFIWNVSISATKKTFSTVSFMMHNPLSALTNLVFRFTSASLLQADKNDRACWHTSVWWFSEFFNFLFKLLVNYYPKYWSATTSFSFKFWYELYQCL